MDSVQIRQCEQNDLPAAQPLLDDLQAQYEHHEEQPLAQRISEFFLVAEEEGCIVGFVIGERRATVNLTDEMGKDAFPNDREYLEIQDLYVMPSARGRGVGTQLMNTLLQKARDYGLARSMVYSANKDYARIAHFYEKFNYRMWHIFMTQ